MAKITGAQNIPSALLDGYRANLAEPRPDTAVVGKRYPYRIPTQQDDGRPSAAKKKQRARFKLAIAKFKTVDEATRERWYAAMPPYSSFLWYYNYFMMSALTGNADTKHGGLGVIKSIQFKTISMPAAGGEGQVAIDAVDPAKTVVMLYGSSFWILEAEGYATTGVVYPYVSSIAAELVKCKWSVAGYGGNNTAAADIGITVIEYI